MSNESHKELESQIATLSFEEAMGQLETIVRKLEEGEGDLEAAIEEYTRGTLLKAHCQKKLSDARLKVEKIMGDGQGGLTTAPLDETQEETA
tara:strand:- start:598 stop:873 length:276 start_codon:yes stop_codon:yes gene_type:complete